MYICDIYESTLKSYCQRFSNNANLIFTDQGLLPDICFAELISNTSKLKSDESQINIWTFGTYDGQNRHRIHLSNFLK